MRGGGGGGEEEEEACHITDYSSTSDYGHSKQKGAKLSVKDTLRGPFSSLLYQYILTSEERTTSL